MEQRAARAGRGARASRQRGRALADVSVQVAERMRGRERCLAGATQRGPATMLDCSWALDRVVRLQVLARADLKLAALLVWW